MDPLNDVVTHVHRIDVRRHDFNTKCILVAERLECLIPPTRAFEQCRPNRFGCATIDVINDWFLSLADTRAGIFLLQTMPRDEALRDRIFDRRGEVHILDSEITSTRIEDTWLEAGRRQLHERMSLANGDRLRDRHNLSHKLARRLARESKSCFNFRVLRKVFCVGEIKRAASRLESISTLLPALQSVRYLVNVAQEEARRIYQNTIAIFGGNFESPERRFGKCIFHCQALVGIVGAGAETIVRRHQQDTWSNAIEPNDIAITELGAIEANVVPSNTGGQRFNVKKLGVPLVDLEP